MSNKLKNILLWVAVLPASILAGLLVLFPVHWILYNTLTRYVQPYPELPERIIGPFATACVMVKTASYVAPSYKIIVATILTVFWIFIAGGGFALSYFNVDSGTYKYSLIAGGLPIISGVIGAIIALISELRNSDTVAT